MIEKVASGSPIRAEWANGLVEEVNGAHAGFGHGGRDMVRSGVGGVEFVGKADIPGVGVDDFQPFEVRFNMTEGEVVIYKPSSETAAYLGESANWESGCFGVLSNSWNVNIRTLEIVAWTGSSGVSQDSYIVFQIIKGGSDLKAVIRGVDTLTGNAAGDTVDIADLNITGGVIVASEHFATVWKVEGSDITEGGVSCWQMPTLRVAPVYAEGNGILFQKPTSGSRVEICAVWE